MLSPGVDLAVHLVNWTLVLLTVWQIVLRICAHLTFPLAREAGEILLLRFQVNYRPPLALGRTGFFCALTTLPPGVGGIFFFVGSALLT